MAHFSDPVTSQSTALVPYVPKMDPSVQMKTLLERTHDLAMEKSFKIQKADSQLRSAYMYSYTDHDAHEDRHVFRAASGNFIHQGERGPQEATVRSVILAGALPSPQIGPGLPPQFPDTMEKFLDDVRDVHGGGDPCSVRQTVNLTINNINYNGLQPFNKAAKQVSEGTDFLDTQIDSHNEEETGSTCIGMSHAILKQLREKHGVEGAFAAQRQRGRDALEHACVIVECMNGYVLIDPRSFPNERIFEVPHNRSVIINGKTFTGDKPRSTTPVIETHPYTEERPEMEFEYCTNIANSDDIIAKHFMMEASSFPVAAYFQEEHIATHYEKAEHKKAGKGANTIWVSLLRPAFTFVNETLQKGDAGKRKEEIGFQDVFKDNFPSRLKRFNQAGRPPTYNIDLEFLNNQLVRFVNNAPIINRIFHEVYQINEE